MTKGLARRLDRLARAVRPGRCHWVGARCVQHAVVGYGSEDPSMPELPATRADCGRPVLWQVVVVVLLGVDASRL